MSKELENRFRLFKEAKAKLAELMICQNDLNKIDGLLFNENLEKAMDSLNEFGSKCHYFENGELIRKIKGIHK